MAINGYPATNKALVSPDRVDYFGALAGCLLLLGGGVGLLLILDGGIPLLGILLSTLVLLGGSLIWALPLRAVGRWVAAVDVPFGRAYLTMLSCGLFGMSISFLIQVMINTLGASIGAAIVTWLVYIPVACSLQAHIVSEGLTVTRGRAALI